MSDKPRIGYIGLGIMGRPMALNLLEAGYTLTVHNRSAAKVKPLTDAGAKDGGSPAGVAKESDLIMLNVTDTPDVVDVMTGEDGVLSACREGQIVIDNSTISPLVTQDLAKQCAERGVAFVDAPVSGGETGAINGTVAIMVGCDDEEVFEMCRPVFDVIGGKAVRVGGSGAGQFTKAANQIILGATYLGLAEALVMVSKAGLDPAKVVEAIDGGAATSWALQHRAPMMIERNFKAGFYAKLHWKDLKIASTTGRGLDMPLPVTNLVTELFTSAVSSGHGEEDHCAVVKVIEKLAGHAMGS